MNDNIQFGLMYLKALGNDADINSYLKDENARLMIYSGENNVGYGYFDSFGGWRYDEPVAAIYVERDGEIEQIISTSGDSALKDLLRENSINSETLRRNLQLQKETIQSLRE